MISKIDICNMALAQLGQEPISSLTQDDERARRCDLFYEPVKKEVLRTHNWAFANTFTSLVLLADDGAPDWPYMYAYPQDCLFLRRVFAQAHHSHGEGAAFKEAFNADLHARVIFCGLPKAQAEYTRDITDEAQFDPAFVKAFSLALAADLAVTLTGDNTLAQQVLQKYTLALQEARRSNMSERFDVRAGRSAFVEAR